MPLAPLPSGCPCCGPKARSALWDKLMAGMMARGAVRYNALPAVAARKAALFARLLHPAGGAPPARPPLELLEIGAGTGANVGFLPPPRAAQPLRLTAVEPNSAMHPLLAQTWAAAGFAPQQLTLAQGVGEALPVPDGSQDAVVSTLVLCSVTDQRQVLSEVLRVLKPGGCFLFCEHVAAPLGSWTRSLQEVVQPAWGWLTDGCHVNRETWLAVQSSGFAEVQLEHFEASANPLFGLIAPHIAGVATKG